MQFKIVESHVAEEAGAYIAKLELAHVIDPDDPPERYSGDASVIWEQLNRA